MKINTKILLKAIYDKCLDCSETAKEIKECTVKRCPLYEYRNAYMDIKNKDSDLSKTIRSLK